MPSSNEIATGSVGSTSKYCWPFAGVVPPPSVVISMSVPVADIVPPSPITAAAIAIARSVRPLLGTAGSLRVDKSFFRPAICTWSSHCPIAWPHWCYRTRRSSTACCSVPVRKPFSKWLAIRGILVQRLVSSACYTLGVSNSKFIRTFIVLFLPAASHLITPAGFVRETTTSCPKKCLGNLSRQVCRCARAGFSEWPASLRGRSETSRSTQDLCRLVAAAVSTRMGGLLETSLRWPRICAALSGPLHSSRGHLQPSPGRPHRWPSHFSLA